MKLALVILILAAPVGGFRPRPRVAACLVSENAVHNTAAAPVDPTCSGPHPSGIGNIQGYHCGTPLQTRWWIDGGCVLGVVP